jgi:hypothetical protein
VKQDVDGATTVDEHPLKTDTVDAGVEDEGGNDQVSELPPTNPLG